MILSKLNLPTFNFQLKQEERKYYIWDIIRRKYVFLQSEEWIRQHIVHFLIQRKNYPKSLIRVEVGFTYNNGVKKRADIVVYNRKGTAFLLVECKASYLKLTKNTFYQTNIYNLAFRSAYLCMTNGLEHYCWQPHFQIKNYCFFKDFPIFENK